MTSKKLFQGRLEWLIILLFSPLLLALETRADVLQLDNGDRLTGTIVSRTETEVVLENPIFGRLSIPAERVEAVEPAPATLAQAQPKVEEPEKEPVPSVTTTDAEASGLAAGEELEEKSENQPQATAGEAGKPFLQGPLVDWIKAGYPLKEWDSSLTLGFTMQTGEIDRRDLALRFNSTRNTPDNEFKLGGQYDYGETEKEGLERTVNNRYIGDFRWRHDLRERYFLQSFTRYESDKIKRIEHDFTQSLGIGWRYIDTDRAKGSIVPSCTFRYRKLETSPDTMDYAFTLFQDFSYEISDRWSFEQSLDASIVPDNLDDFTADFVAKVSYDINSSMTLDGRYELDYDHQLAREIDELRQKFILGVGVKF